MNKLVAYTSAASSVIYGKLIHVLLTADHMLLCCIFDFSSTF